MAKERTRNPGVDEDYLRSLIAGSTPLAPVCPEEESLPSVDQAQQIQPQEETPPSARGKQSDYTRRFLSPYRCENRQGVYIDRELHRKISVIIGVVGKRNLTVGNYIDNVLTRHFEQHGEDVKSFCSKGYNKIL